MPADEMAIFVIYQRPLDYPTRYVVRKWLIEQPGWATPTEHFTLHDTLEQARATIPAYMVRIEREREDALSIVESYI